MKPYEVEILVAQVGATTADHDQLFHILYDGTVMDEEGFTVLGGQAEPIAEALATRLRADADVGDAVKLGAKVLAGDGHDPLAAGQLEVALLDRTRRVRSFRRIKGDELEAAARELSHRGRAVARRGTTIAATSSTSATAPRPAPDASVLARRGPVRRVPPSAASTSPTSST